MERFEGNRGLAALFGVTDVFLVACATVVAIGVVPRFASLTGATAALVVYTVGALCGSALFMLYAAREASASFVALLRRCAAGSPGRADRDQYAAPAVPRSQASRPASGSASSPLAGAAGLGVASSDIVPATNPSASGYSITARAAPLEQNRERRLILRVSWILAATSGSNGIQNPPAILQTSWIGRRQAFRPLST